MRILRNRDQIAMVVFLHPPVKKEYDVPFRELIISRDACHQRDKNRIRDYVNKLKTSWNIYMLELIHIHQAAIIKSLAVSIHFINKIFIIQK